LKIENGKLKIVVFSCCVSTSVRDLCQNMGETVVGMGKPVSEGKAGVQNPEERSDEGF
jgi:hypothetical protein